MELDNSRRESFGEDSTPEPRRRGRARQRHERRRQRQGRGQGEDSRLDAVQGSAKAALDSAARLLRRDSPVSTDEALPRSTSAPVQHSVTVDDDPLPPPEPRPAHDDLLNIQLNYGAPSRNRERESRAARSSQVERRQPSRQVIPQNPFRIDENRIGQLRSIFYVVASIALVGGIIFGLSMFKSEEPQVGSHALWLGPEYTYENPSTAEIEGLAAQLRSSRIGVVYAWTSWLRDDNSWAGDPGDFTEVAADLERFVERLNTAFPEVTVYAWIRVPVNVGPEGYRLNDTAMQDNVAAFSRTLVDELALDGVFIDVDPVWNDNADDYVDLLQRVRLQMGDAGAVAVAVPPDWSPAEANIPLPPRIAPGTEWAPQFKQRVALLADQVVIKSFNSGFSTPTDYIQWVAYQVEAYASAIDSLNTRTQLLIGVPTYGDDLNERASAAENVTSALEGVDTGRRQVGDAASRVAGAALYAEWTTDGDEWRQFDQWAQRN